MSGCWAIVLGEEVRATGETEGQAWINFLRLTGKCFRGHTLLYWRAHYDGYGYRAVELRGRA